MSDTSSKPSLTELGTRYDHYVELREVFANGVEVIEGMSKRGHATTTDLTLRVKLESAVEVINKRLEFLSDYRNKMTFSAELPTTIRAVHTQAQIEKGKQDAENRRQGIEQAAKNSNQVCPEKDSGDQTLNA